MKKTLIFVAVAAMFVFAGCSKGKECNCTVTKTMYEPMFNQWYTITYDTIQTITAGTCGDLNTHSTTAELDDENVTLEVECVERQ